MSGNTPYHVRKAIERQAREERAVELRVKGLSYQAIAREMGVSKFAVYKDVERAIDKLNRKLPEDTDKLRRIESERLDLLQVALWPEAVTGNIKAGEQVLKLMERRAKLWGLDAPAKQEITSTDMQIRVILRANANGNG